MRDEPNNENPDDTPQHPPASIAGFDGTPVGVLILACEGGGETVLARFVDGAWQYWSEGSVLVLDDPGDEEWRGFQRGPASHLRELLTGNWFLLHPVAINEQFQVFKDEMVSHARDLNLFFN